MEAQIHLLTAVLRAFEAQSDAISWDKEGLITELRKELRVSDDEHRELLSRVNKDDTIGRIRDWRQGGGSQVPSRHATNQGFDVVPSPTLSASRKKQKTFQSLSVIFVQYHPIVVWYLVAYQQMNLLKLLSEEKCGQNGSACLYDINAVNETWEWISPEDICWDGEENGAALNVGVGSGSIRGNRRNQSHFGRGRGPRIHQPKNEFVRLPTQQNGGDVVDRRTYSDDIELFNTDSLVKEVERVFESRNPDLFELDKAKKMLKEHEQALIDAIAGLADTSDGEIDGDPPFLQDHPISQG
ncbi:hypothetical protein Bca52824_066754 [Brassica carinata]|uniref:ENT domain-containing protein n=1 Tax=Brassica carinata TaxID=52824 RepID=A0A8X7QRV1_BRACI|nr:hypothetical protein Bca52824_066754 [Brassica carinata]